MLLNFILEILCLLRDTLSSGPRDQYFKVGNDNDNRTTINKNEHTDSFRLDLISNTIIGNIFK